MKVKYYIIIIIAVVCLVLGVLNLLNLTGNSSKELPALASLTPTNSDGFSVKSVGDDVEHVSLQSVEDATVKVISTYSGEELSRRLVDIAKNLRPSELESFFEFWSLLPPGKVSKLARVTSIVSVCENEANAEYILTNVDSWEAVLVKQSHVNLVNEASDRLVESGKANLALRLLAEFPDEYSTVVEAAFPNLFWHWMREDFDASFTAIQQLPEGSLKSEVVSHSFRRAGLIGLKEVYQRDPRKVLTLLDVFESESERSRAVYPLADAIAKEDPMGGIKASYQVLGDNSKLLRRSIVKNWVSYDKNTALDWVGSQLDTVLKGEAERWISDSIRGIAENDRESAEAWLGRISDPEIHAEAKEQF